MQLSFEVPRITPSGWKYLHRHWGYRHKLRQTFEWEIKAITSEFIEKYPEAIAKEGERRKLVITSFRPRRIDPDNVISGLKPCIDALKNLGLIWDDSEKCLELIVNQDKAHGFPKTRITIYFDKP